MDEPEVTVDELRELVARRIYVTFSLPQDATGQRRESKSICFGPYVAVNFESDHELQLHYLERVVDEDGKPEGGILASYDSRGWKLHDGMEESSPFFQSVVIGSRPGATGP